MANSGLLLFIACATCVAGAPCDTNTTLCKSLDINSYCGQSTDPQAVCTDGSGCSCNWGWQYNATRTGHGHCRPPYKLTTPFDLHSKKRKCTLRYNEARHQWHITTWTGLSKTVPVLQSPLARGRDA